MSLWEKFYQSGKVEDYLNYRRFEKEVTTNDNLKGSDFKGK